MPKSQFTVIKAKKNFPYGSRFPIIEGELRIIRHSYNKPVRPLPKLVAKIRNKEPIEWGGNTVHPEHYNLIYEGTRADMPEELANRLF